MEFVCSLPHATPDDAPPDPSGRAWFGRFDSEEGPIASHDQFDLTPGTDIGAIDDSTVPPEVRNRIFAPATAFIRDCSW